MRIVVDEDMAGARAAFAPWGEVIPRPGRHLAAVDVAAADALAVRSVTRVDADLLAGSRVRFVGSATIGTDHVDRDWLAAHGIGFAHAPGCNADAVADWVVACLATLDRRGAHALGRGTAGIVGAGNVGSRVARRLAALGYEVRCCDPPRARAEGDSGFVDLATALSSDVVSLHVPLTHNGPHPTRDLIDARALAAMRPGAALLNAARGGVVAESALLQRLIQGPPLHAAIDTWQGEPEIDVALLDRVDLGTPHIAGHSREGKLRGTAAVAAAAADFFGLELAWDWRSELPAAPGPPSASDRIGVILEAYDPTRDDGRLRGAMAQAPAERGAAFDALRRDYPLRREFASWRTTDSRSELRAAGFVSNGGDP